MKYFDLARMEGFLHALFKYQWYFTLLLQTVLSLLTIFHVPYTEIDWMTYMTQVKIFLNGERNYIKIRGSTGPLVYPAGFLYVFSMLYWATEQGTNVFFAQFFFAAVNILTFSLVTYIYQKIDVYPAFRCLFFSFSRRIYSIHMLRLFNDPVAMLFFYTSLFLFMEGHWRIGSLFFSFAVSIKMNVLLFSPALLLLFFTSGNLYHVSANLLICAGSQIILGAPFLLTDFSSYLKKSFELDRKFDYFWSVNMKIFPENLFEKHLFSLSLVICHVLLLYVFYSKKWQSSVKYPHRKSQYTSQAAAAKRKEQKIELSSLFVLSTLFESNLIGILCSRSLHYQFFSWYFHSLAFLLWNTGISFAFQILLYCAIEISWNVYPSTFMSSLTLNVAHVVLLSHRFIGHVHV